MAYYSPFNYIHTYYYEVVEPKRVELLYWPSYQSPEYGGGWRDRTADPLLAKQVLSHLS
jgi:hypothetical protein